MPAPEPVAAALAAASGVHRALQDADVPMLAARATLLRSVDFEESGSYRPELRHALKAKYLLLRPNSGSDQPVSNEGRNEENSLPSPKNVLFPVSSVRHGWRQGWQVGSGMQNMGNTCYLNSTLQALFHVSPFANWLISDSHSEKCCQNGGCVICGMRKTLIETQNAGGSIKPWQVYSKLRQICRHLIPGRQEDAHEFLRYLVEAMEKSYLSQYDGTGIILDQYSKETTPLNQILGGYLRSVVRCLACRRDSTTFQHFQDLLVDARKASAIDEALETFFSLERLEDLGYKCEFCNKKVSATKQFFIERAPMVLCIALKRFSLTGGKLTKHVQFKPKLSLNKHMFNSKNASPLEYRLVSVVTHLGQSQNCGHYTAVGLGPGGTFYQFDDSCVREISINAVLNTNAYIMFYELITSSNNMNKNNISSTPLSSSQSYKDSKEIISNFIGPLMPKNLKSIDDVSKSNFASSTDTDQEKLSLNGSKPKAFMSLNFRSNENNHNDSSREKTIANFSLSKLNEQKSNGTSKLNSYNKTSHCNSNVQVVSASGINSNAPSSSKMLNGSNKASLVNSMAHSNPSLNDKMVQSEKRNISNGNLILNSEQKSDNSQNSEQKVNGAVFKLVNGNHRTLCDSNSALSETINGCGTQKLVNGTDLSELNSSKFKSKSSVTNGSMSGISPLVPYDSESSGENQDDYEDDKSNSSAHQKNSTSTSTITNSTSQGWRVSHKSPESRHSPIQHRNSNNKSSSENREQQPSTSIESKDKNTVGQLQRLSHRGYGGPVNTWAGTHAQLNRQVFDDKKSELKRAAEADDEMDRGRSKKVRHNNYGYHNGRNNNSYNAFQATQNQIHKWGSNGKSFRKFNNYNKSFKHKSRGRFNSQYPRHSNNHHYNNQYHRNH